MKKTFLLTGLIIGLTLTSYAQTDPAEQEILKIHAALDNAFIKKDTAFFENILAADYVYSDPQGKTYDRTGNLEQLKKEFANTT